MSLAQSDRRLVDELRQRFAEDFAAGRTVPFLARYERDRAEGAPEAVLWEAWESWDADRRFANRRRSLAAELERDGQLTDALRQRIGAATSRRELEEIQRPFRAARRRTKASVARGQGLEPLADLLADPDAWTAPPEDLARPFVDSSRGVTDATAALEGAAAVLAERMAYQGGAIRTLADRLRAEGVLLTSVAGEHEQASRYKAFAAHREGLAAIPGHRLFAILRGHREGAVRYHIEFNGREENLRQFKARNAPGAGTPRGVFLDAVADQAFAEVVSPEAESLVIKELREDAEQRAVRVFQQNLSHLFMAPPAGGLRVLGVEAALRGGMHMAAVDGAGKRAGSLSQAWPWPEEHVDTMKAEAVKLLRDHGIQAVAVGQGPGGRDVERTFRALIRDHGLTGVFTVLVDEAGVRQYPSPLEGDADRDVSPSIRRALSIARRLQDPLAEWVNVDPRHIGVGQYQHDITPERLHAALERTLLSCVNQVGVDLNTAPPSLLRFVSGLDADLAVRIVAQRATRGGRYRNRAQLREVEGMTDAVFEQCAGFLRVTGGDQPLDKAFIHPRQYDLVERLARQAGLGVEDLVGHPAKVDRLSWERASGEAGPLMLAALRQELARPGKDPRGAFEAPHFLDSVRNLGDLQPGMDLEGRISNVTPFGAFVDLGIEQDGLVHVSELSQRFVDDPSAVVHVGQVVKVRVLTVDREARRLSLSIKALQPPPARPRAEGPRGAGPAGARRSGPPLQGQRPPRGESGPRPDGPRPGGPHPERRPRAASAPPPRAESGDRPPKGAPREGERRHPRPENGDRRPSADRPPDNRPASDDAITRLRNKFKSI